MRTRYQRDDRILNQPGRSFFQIDTRIKGSNDIHVIDPRIEKQVFQTRIFPNCRGWNV